MVTVFTFRSGKSPLHCLDVRYKAVMVCLLSLALLKTSGWGCLACFIVLLICIRSIGLSFRSVLKQLKLFILFLGAIFLVRCLVTPGDTLIERYGISVTRQGLEQGGLVTARFFLVMLTGLVFSATTRPASLKAAAQWFLKPVPFVPEKRVAVMISLSLRFLPLIFKQARETGDALRARCGDQSRNPFRRIFFQAMPLLKKTFTAADNLAMAMDARCYSEDRTDPSFGSGGGTSSERLFFIAGLLLCICLVTLS